jgi:type I restriction enzyme S subunit
MKYRLGDICTITKGDTGIMKAIPGEFTMVALGEADKTHNEFQFDTKAVIIPLVSSTGHGHASMKRVKYQEGKFSLGSILCAVIPKDENFVLAKYLHIYLHWNREELLVSQMKGMANVSLPMNRIADVIVTVPSLDKQKEIIELEMTLVKRENEVDSLFADQLTQLENLKQAILQEAVQGKLVAQDKKDEPASELLKRIREEKAKSGKKEKPFPPIKPEEIPFEIPESWLWCRLGEICDNITKGSSPNWQGVQYVDKANGILYITSKNVDSFKIDLTKATYVEEKFNEIEPRSILKKGDILTNIVGASIGRTALFDLDVIANINQAVCILRIEHNHINKNYLLNLMNSNLALKLMTDSSFAPGRANLSMGNIANFPIPLPPLSEQKRIVAEIEKQLAKIKQLKEHIIANQQATEQLLKALLHQAFEVEEMEEV